MMKKLIALLTALLLLTSPALAEMPGLSGLLSLLGGTQETEPAELTEEEAASVIYTMINEELDAENLTYEKREEYQYSYLSMILETPSALGSCADVVLYAFWDGVSIEASCENPIDPARVNEVIQLCNLFNSAFYIGNFCVQEFDGTAYLNYEVFLPMNASHLNEYDRYSVMEYAYFAADMIQYYQEYFQMVLDGETARNVYAMWEADSE